MVGHMALRRRVSRWVALAVVMAGLVGTGVAGVGHAADGERCRLVLEGAPAVFAHCPSISVPLDPDHPDGETIDLFVARVPSLSATPDRDPLVLISGGPGQSAVDLYLQMRGAFEQVRRDRDLLLIDQRGTGRSARGLHCTMPDDTPAMEEATPELLEALTASCLEQLEHDPRLYTTSVAVRDLDHVRSALGYRQWNLYGVSYGTRVAQHYLRRYPANTRALILDAVVPAGMVLGPDIAPLAQQALDAVFARCEADEACAARFGDLPAHFRALQASIEAQPVQVSATDSRSGEAAMLQLGLPQLRAVTRLMIYAPATAALLPLTISAAADGNHLPLAAQAGIVLRGLEEALGLAMHNSVACTEDAPFIDRATLQDSADTFLGTSVVEGLLAMCELWPAGVMDADFREPLASEVPILMLSGENDPITPPAYAEQAIAGGLRNVVHLLATGQGHGLAAVGCVPSLMRSFLRSADPQQLNGRCLNREQVAPFFLGFNGPSP